MQLLNLNKPKYSIIIPTYNGISYLPTCIETIISQDYNNYELIISDDNSTDGTKEYLETLSHRNIIVIYPPKLLSMTEHWEWALAHAKGDWQIFVGQDDGLQAYFFQLADKLTASAREKGLRAIMSSRAYFFWRGCEHVYGDIAVSYKAENIFKVKNIKYEAFKALFNFQTYFELPQMYTTALFHKKLLDEARAMQDGKVFSCHPQDANLAAVAFSLERYYLKSYIPLGWVGSSPKSAGMAISGSIISEGVNEIVRDEQIALKREYLNKVKKSKLKYHDLAGDFSIGSGPLYFWQALLMTEKLRSAQVNSLVTSRIFKTLFFSRILYSFQIDGRKSKTDIQRNQFSHVLEVNHCNKLMLYICVFLLALLTKPIHFLFRAIKKSLSVFNSKSVCLYVNWHDNNEVNMNDTSHQLNLKLSKKKWF